jgi:hypothetical protein
MVRPHGAWTDRLGSNSSSAPYETRHKQVALSFPVSKMGIKTLYSLGEQWRFQQVCVWHKTNRVRRLVEAQHIRPVFTGSFFVTGCPAICQDICPCTTYWGRLIPATLGPLLQCALPVPPDLAPLLRVPSFLSSCSPLSLCALPLTLACSGSCQEPGAVASDSSVSFLN